MNRIRDCTALAFMIACAIHGPSGASAQEADGVTSTVLTIRPAKAAVPALKYHLLPERREMVSGNAAIFYHRACLMYATGPRDSKGEEKILGYLSGPPTGIDAVSAWRYVESHRNILHEAELGAFSQDCNWQFDDRKEGFNLLLPEVQEIRRVGRLVALRARLAVIDSRFDDAVHWLKVGFAMSRHLGMTPFLIPGLVGDAIAGTLKQPLEDLIQKQGAPSLYWAFATRIRPVVDMRRAVEGERYIIDREFPDLRRLDGPAWSAEKARVFGDELFEKLRNFTGEMQMIAPVGAKLGTGTPRLEDLPSRLALAALVARVYPEAKRELIAGGKTPGDVDSMPTLQVALIHTLRSYEEFRDDVFKWAALPYSQSRNRMDQAWKNLREPSNKLANPLLRLFTNLMPAIESALLANARVERQLDVFQCVEAIRIHAANHGGTLLANLDAMADTPLPLDPITGKPFDYKKLDETTAILSAPYPPSGSKVPQYAIRYELRLAK